MQKKLMLIKLVLIMMAKLLILKIKTSIILSKMVSVAVFKINSINISNHKKTIKYQSPPNSSQKNSLPTNPPPQNSLTL
jgi:hypothetical protein